MVRERSRESNSRDFECEKCLNKRGIRAKRKSKVP
jgi:hypothetical protein